MCFARGDALAARIEHAAEAEWRQQERQIERGAEHGRAEIGLRWRVHALARPEGHVGKRALIGAQRDLVLGAAVDIVEDHWRQTALRHPAQVGNVDDL